MGSIDALSRTYRRLRGLSWPRDYPIAQFPNPPLIVALVAFALRWVTPEAWADALTAIGYVFLAAWAYLELAEGVNLFRRVLGAAALVYVIVLIATAGVATAAAAAHQPTARAHSVGGQVVPSGTAPWAVALEALQAEDTPAAFCSGALISPTYVLTAAHCAQIEGLNSAAAVRKAQLAVRFGNLPGRPAVAARRMTLPGGYWVFSWGTRQQSDIALVELAAPAPTAPHPLSHSAPAEGAPITALGYGTTPTSPVLSTDLMQAWSLVSAPGPCGGMAPAGYTVKVFPQTETCAVAGPSGTTPPLDGATCGGDSGGPWLAPDLSAIVGVTSWGRLNACRQPPNLRTSVFAKLNPVAGWLKRQTGAPLFGEAPVPVDHAGPRGATLRTGQLGAAGLPVAVSARGTNWKAAVFVTFCRDGDAQPVRATVVVGLGPRHPSGVARPPASWGPNPPGLDASLVGARVWRPDNLNGVTLTTDG